MVLEQEEGGDVVGMSAGVSTPCQNIPGLLWPARPYRIVPPNHQPRPHRYIPTSTANMADDKFYRVLGVDKVRSTFRLEGGWQLLPQLVLLFSVRPTPTQPRQTDVSTLPPFASLGSALLG